MIQWVISYGTLCAGKRIWNLKTVMPSSTTALKRVDRFLNSWKSDVVSIVLIGWAIKLFVAQNVAVNGDSGLYLYDAQQILMGRIQFVEFPSRSPVFEHLLAGAIAVGGKLLPSARAMMIGISLALGVAIYVFARQLHSHRAGLVSMLVFYLTPFTLVWGTWIKTEQAAALTTVCAFIVAVHVIDREHIPLWAMGAVGSLFAVSYLIRRVAIVHIGAFALFVILYRYHKGYTARSTFGASGGVLASAAVVMAVAYVALVRGDIGLAWRVFDVHTLALFQSGGQGSLGWVGLGDPVAITAEDGTSLFAQVCQKCGVNTVEVFAKTTLVTLPALAGLFMFLRAGLRSLDEFVSDVGVPVVVFVAVGWRLSRGDLPLIAAWSLASVALVIGAVWLTKPVTLRDVWTDKLALPVFVLLALAAGYLYRDRILYTTYFQDFMPFVAVLSGIALVAWLRRNTLSLARVGFAIVLILAAVTAGIHADPYQPDRDDQRSHWFTTELVDQYGDDIDARTERASPVFTAQPLYVIHSDAYPLADLSRRYYLFRGWPEDDMTAELTDQLVADLEAGRAPYAINDSNLHEMTSESPRLRTALDQHYCPVDAPLYERTGGQLLVHENNDPSCN